MKDYIAYFLWSIYIGTIVFGLLCELIKYHLPSTKLGKYIEEKFPDNGESDYYS